jgi:phosphoribosyl-ATP pyrophosphohydrolase/phosphoribosyl-AMP cyclohydrolase
MGPACHTGERTCFGDLSPDLLLPPHGGSPGAGRTPEGEEEPGPGAAPSPAGPRPPEEILPRIWSILETRAAKRPKESYTVRLLEDENLRLKKLGEETAELILALSRQEQDRIPQEGADLVYHLLVALLAEGVTLEDLLAELEARMK